MQAPLVRTALRCLRWERGGGRSPETRRLPRWPRTLVNSPVNTGDTNPVLFASPQLYWFYWVESKGGGGKVLVLFMVS